MIESKKIQDIIKEFGKNEKDSGSIEVQIALLTHHINNLSVHMKNNKKDIVTKRNLIKKVDKRKKMLKYLNINNHESYKNILQKLSLRK